MRLNLRYANVVAQVPNNAVEECDGMGNTGQLQHFINSAICTEMDSGALLPVSWTATEFQVCVSCCTVAFNHR